MKLKKTPKQTPENKEPHSEAINRAKLMNELVIKTTAEDFKSNMLYSSIVSPEFKNKYFPLVSRHELLYFIKNVCLPKGQKSLSFFQALQMKIGLSGGLDIKTVQNFLIRLSILSSQKKELKDLKPANDTEKNFIEQLKKYVEPKNTMNKNINLVFEKIKISHKYREDLDEAITEIKAQRPEKDVSELQQFMDTEIDIKMNMAEIRLKNSDLVNQSTIFGLTPNEMLFLFKVSHSLKEPNKSQLIEFLTYIRDREDIKEIPSAFEEQLNKVASAFIFHHEPTKNILLKINHQIRYIESRANMYREKFNPKKEKEILKREVFLRKPIELSSEEEELLENIETTKLIKKFTKETALNETEVKYLIHILAIEKNSKEIKNIISFLNEIVQSEKFSLELQREYPIYLFRLLDLSDEDEAVDLILKKLINTKEHQNFEQILKQEKEFKESLLEMYKEAKSLIKEIKSYIQKYYTEAEKLRDGCYINEGNPESVKGMAIFMSKGTYKLVAALGVGVAALAGMIPAFFLLAPVVYPGYKFMKGRMFTARTHELRLEDYVIDIKERMKKMQYIQSKMQRNIEFFKKNIPNFEASNAGNAILEDISPRIVAISQTMLNHDLTTEDPAYLWTILHEITYYGNRALDKWWHKKPPKIPLEESLESYKKIKVMGHEQDFCDKIDSLLDHCDQTIKDLDKNIDHLKNNTAEQIKYTNRDFLKKKLRKVQGEEEKEEEEKTKKIL